jgi:hypothetical protein
MKYMELSTNTVAFISCGHRLTKVLHVPLEFVNDMDGPAFLERELMELGEDGYF